jgi:hypothetical protein
MGVRLLDDSANIDVQRLRIDDLIIRRVDAVGELLDASHKLLKSVFDTAVIDGKDVYIDAINDDSGTFRDFPPIFLASVFHQKGNDFVAGFISADIMLLGGSTKTQLAIGNIATAPRLRELQFRGVGSKLWHAAFLAAEEEVQRANKRLDFSSSEAESASLPFWAKLGYRWPKGIKYFQPPLEFDDRGDPVYEEVAETLLIHPLKGASDSIDAGDLRELIKSIYWNWGIRPSLRKLNPEALAAATKYVMELTFARTMASIPVRGSIPLIEVPQKAIQ